MTGPHRLDSQPNSGGQASGAPPEPDAIYDAGALGCGDGPLTKIAATLKQMQPGAVLEVRSTNPGVTADLPAWCRMVGHSFLGEGPDGGQGRYFIQRKHD